MTSSTRRARSTTSKPPGIDLIWVAEAYGFDAVSVLGYLAGQTETVELGAGILPIYTRTPTLLAMTAAGLDELSDGRFVLGLGASGPQVIEGFHGVPYDRPIARTREIIDICRTVWAREAPLTHDGDAYQVPLPPDRGTGLGKPLKIIAHPKRAHIPVHVAALGEKNVAMTAEVADGWLPLFYLPERADAVFGASLAAGAAKRATDLGPLEVTAGGIACVGEPDEAKAALDTYARPMTALYVGGMGAKGRNFYNTLVPALRLRGRGGRDPGPLSLGPEDRSGRRHPRRPARAHQPVRVAGLRAGTARGIPRRRRHDHERHPGQPRPRQARRTTPRLARLAVGHTSSGTPPTR